MWREGCRGWGEAIWTTCACGDDVVNSTEGLENWAEAIGTTTCVCEGDDVAAGFAFTVSMFL